MSTEYITVNLNQSVLQLFILTNKNKTAPTDECLNQSKLGRIFVRCFLDLVLTMSEIPKLLLNSGYRIPQLGLGTFDVMKYKFINNVDILGASRQSSQHY